LKGALTLQAGSDGASSEPARRHASTQASRRSATVVALAERTAESCFLKAIEIARRQQARVFELRAATALSHLWVEQGRTDAARGLLSSIYTSFTKGHDTADLREAKSLLEPPDGRPASQLPRDSGQRGSARPRTRRTR